MSRHYPALPPQSRPTTPWPDAVVECSGFTADLYWVGEEVPERPGWLPRLCDLTVESSEGEPEGRLLGSGGVYRPVYHHHHQNGDWWVQDGVTGEVLAGELSADRRAAGKRLGFLTALSLVLAFLGGSIVISLAVAMAAGLGVRTALRGGNAMFAPLLGLFLGGMAVFWVIARLAQVLPPALKEAVDRVESGRLVLPGDQRWRSVFSSFGLLLVVVTLFALLTCISTRDAGALMIGLLQAGLGGWLVWHFLKAGQGLQLKADPAVELRGPSGELVLLALRVGLFALAGTGLASVAQRALSLPLDPSMVAARGGEIGAILAVVASRPRHGLALVVALVVKFLGDMFLGPWLALVLAALTVVGLAQERGRPALKRAWGFSVGLVGGRLIGRAFGLFFLGTGGVAVGEILAEQLAATVGWQVAGEEEQSDTPRDSNEASAEALPEDSGASQPD